jgi:hypothetical protein
MMVASTPDTRLRTMARSLSRVTALLSDSQASRMARLRSRRAFLYCADVSKIAWSRSAAERSVRAMTPLQLASTASAMRSTTASRRSPFEPK